MLSYNSVVVPASGRSACRHVAWTSAKKPCQDTRASQQHLREQMQSLLGLKIFVRSSNRHPALVPSEGFVSGSGCSRSSSLHWAFCLWVPKSHISLESSSIAPLCVAKAVAERAAQGLVGDRGGFRFEVVSSHADGAGFRDPSRFEMPHSVKSCFACGNIEAVQKWSVIVARKTSSRN